MELRQLKYFKEACERQNFSEAARMLHISQSTLSQQIKQLEDELDVLLFDRIGKRIVPTEAGQAFLPYAIRAIHDAEDGKQIIRDLKGIETGVLRIGVTYSMSPLLIATLELVDKICELATNLTDTELKSVSWSDFVGSLDDSTEPELITYLKERQFYINTPITSEEDD